MKDQSAELLKGLRVVDLGHGMPAALIVQYLIATGADVRRVPPKGGDPFAEIYEADSVWRDREAVEADHTDERLMAMLSSADVCIIGGEEFPGLKSRLTAADAAATNPRLIVLIITAYPEGVQTAHHHGTELLVQANSGLAYEHYSSRPVFLEFGPVTYGTALNGLTGLLAALYEREQSGLGQIVSTSLLGGAFVYGSYLWPWAERPCAESQNVLPIDPQPLILECSDGEYVYIALAQAGARARGYRAMGLDASLIDPSAGVQKAGGPPEEFFGPVKLFQRQAKQYTRPELLERLWAEGLAAEAVLKPGECWDHPQTVANAILTRDSRGRRHVGLPAAIRRGPRTSERPASAPGKQPLAGVRVLDLGIFVAGPFVSAVLADLGAEVIKVESPGGDVNRISYPSFVSANRGKKSVTADLKTQDGRQFLYDLAKTSDVVISNFRGGVSKRLGADPDALWSVAPHLIILEAPAFGVSGPKAEQAGFDPVVQAYCGLIEKGGGTGNPPLYNRLAACDYTSGLLSAATIVMALYHRKRSGESASISVPMLNVGLYMSSDIFQAPDGAFHSLPSVNHAQAGRHPSESMYQARDGWIAVAARSAAAARRLARALGLEERLDHDPKRWGEVEHAAIGAAVATRTLVELREILDKHDVWSEPCRRGVAEWFGDSTLRSLGAVWEAPHARFGRVRHVGTQINFSRSQQSPGMPAPDLGQHTAEFSRELAQSSVSWTEFGGGSKVLG